MKTLCTLATLITLVVVTLASVSCGNQVTAVPSYDPVTGEWSATVVLTPGPVTPEK